MRWKNLKYLINHNLVFHLRFEGQLLYDLIAQVS